MVETARIMKRKAVRFQIQHTREMYLVATETEDKNPEENETDYYQNISRHVRGGGES